MTLLVVPPADAPELTIAMVLYRGGALALDALGSVVERSSVPTEIVVVDNASPDASGALVRWATRGIKFFANGSNRGFGGAMNQAVAAATAPFVVLLNPDVVVQPGWDTALVAALRRFPTAAAVSAVLVDPDGSVQEAGGVVDEHGHTHPIGGAELPVAGDELVAGPVDYASAAALAVRRDVFVDVGGFDPRYHPAYFEDADLCFRLRAAGWEIRVEPEARVVHRRGGTDVDDRARFIAKASHGIFVERWGAELARRAEFLAGPGERTALLRRLPG